ncbi:MAG: protein kinase [Polyangiaceae bacterium]
MPPQEPTGLDPHAVSPAPPEDRKTEETRQLGPPAPHANAKTAHFEAGAAIGHYEVIRPLGRGGMGEVVLARDTRLGRRVALKFLLKVDRERLARFEIEARATAQLAHESIVALYDVGEHEGMPFMALEYVPGKSLSDWLKERAEAEGAAAGLPPVRAAELMLPVANALVCAHAAGIVHRDLKPANIMLADSGKVRVLDFGIAKLLDVDGAPQTASDAGPQDNERAATGELTEAGRALGTLAYMAPEQWRSEPLDGRVDLWAVGLILYRLVTGEHPLSPLSTEDLIRVAMLDEPMPSVRERLPDIGPLGAVIDRCLVKRAEDRLGSAQELAGALSAIVRPHASATGRDSEEENPYAGLAAFQERDAARFFGREALVEQVVSRLAEQPLLALVGSSGAGKSSLARAGVIPALKRGGDAWEAFVVRPGLHPLSALAELLLQARWQRSSGSGDDTAPTRPTDNTRSLGSPESLTERLAREPGLLGAQARDRARRRRERVLLFIDQFEEVYTLASDEERDAFLACLAGAADDPSSPVRIPSLDPATSSIAWPWEALRSRSSSVVAPSSSVRSAAKISPARVDRACQSALVPIRVGRSGDRRPRSPRGLHRALCRSCNSPRLWEGRDQGGGY